MGKLLSTQSLNFWRLCFLSHIIHAKVEYPLLKPLQNLDLIKIASLEDILSMKINAIISRRSRKDFVDSYFIMKELKLSGDEAIDFFKKKFSNYDELVIKKALTYFKDAEKEPEIPLLKKINWEKIKNFFVKEFAKI